MKHHELKPLTPAGITKALERANQYRLLNEPGVAESICRDVLLVDGEHGEARIMLLLSLSDMFDRGMGARFDEALGIAKSLSDPYVSSYYVGIVYERRAKAHQRSTSPASGIMAYEWLLKAMETFAEAERLRPAGDDSAILRWNNCVRRLRAHPELRPADTGHDIAPQLGE